MNVGTQATPHQPESRSQLADGSCLPPLNVVMGLEGLALGGCPINALDLGRALRHRGHIVSVFAIDEDVRVSLLPYAARSGFEVTLLPARASVFARARQIQRFAAHRSADIVHVFGPWLGPAATMAATSVRRRSAVVTNWMMENVSYTPRHTPLILGTKLLQVEAELSHRGRVWLMEPPVDLAFDAPDQVRGSEFRRKVGVQDHEIAVVIVSRLDQHLKAEGITYAMRAVLQVDDARLRLVVVGDGNATTEIQREAKQVNDLLGREAIILTGAMQDPRPAYAGADVSLGMGGSALRALAHALPLVVIGERGFAKVFEPASVNEFYNQGFYGDEAHPDPVGHLAAQLGSMLDEDRRSALGDFGLREVRARFGLDASAEKLERIYRETLAALPRTATRWATAAQLLARGLGHEIKKSTGR